MSNVPNVTNPFLKQLTDALLSCILTNTGDYYLRVDTGTVFMDSAGNPIIPNGSEVRIKIKSSPEGYYANVHIDCINTNGAEAVSGQLDLDKLSTLISFE